MDDRIITQYQEKRYMKALKLVEAEMVSPNGQPHTYYVRSATGNGRYLAATADRFSPRGTCNCKDFKCHASKCKHVQAAEIYELAIDTAKTFAKRECLTYSRLANRLLYDLNTGIPEPLATKVVILFHACLRLARKEEMTGPVELAQIRHSITKLLGGIREIHERLRDNPDNVVAQRQLKHLRASLNDLNTQESRMLLAYH